MALSCQLFSQKNPVLQKLDVHLSACTYCAPKTSTRYTKKHAPKLNSDVCLTKILHIIVKKLLHLLKLKSISEKHLL